MLKRIILIYGLLSTVLFSLARQNNPADLDQNHCLHLYGTIHTRESPDTLILITWKEIFNYNSIYNIPKISQKVPVKDGHFSFEISDFSSVRYVSIGKKIPKYEMYPIMPLYLGSPGDSVSIVITDSTLSFTGKGAEKYTCQYEMAEVRNNALRTVKQSVSRHPFSQNDSTPAYYLTPFDQGIKYNDSILLTELAILDKYKHVLSPYLYEILEANAVGKRKLYQYSTIDGLLLRSIPDRIKETIEGRIKEADQKMSVDPIRDSVLLWSYWYQEFILSKLKTNKKITGAANVFSEIYQELKNRYDGPVRDKLLAVFFLKYGKDGIGMDSLVTDALSFVLPSHSQEILLSFKNSIQKGQTAYNFKLPDRNGRYIQLSDFRGKVVFIDFWYTGCVGCADYYRRYVSQAKIVFKNNPEVVFVSISIDVDKEKWYKSIASGMYTSSDAVNLCTDGEGFRHSVIRYYNVFAYPTPLLIDRDGKIFSATSTELWGGSTPDKLIATIRKAVDLK